MSSAVCEGCGKAGPTLQCPKCKELGLPVALFCGQACFRKVWPLHKLTHTGEEATGQAACIIRTMTEKQQNQFKFTGKLRPGLISPIRKVPATFRRPDYATRADGSSPQEETAYRTTKIVQHNERRLDQIRSVCRIGRKLLDTAVKAAVVGATTDAIDEAVHNACIEHGVYPSTLNYMKFPKSLCTSLNEVICHGIPDSTILQEGDILNLDISCYSKDGVHADLNETIFIGRPSEEDIRLVHTCYESLMLAVRTVVKPDAMYKHIGDCVAHFVENRGYSVVRSVCAHGIGDLFHTNPNIPPYKNNKAFGKMSVGHVFTIEPMINIGSYHDVQWPDNWTIVTRDGKRSAQFEHMMTVTENGAEVMTLSDDNGRPHYQRQLEEWGIPLPDISAAEKAPKAEAKEEKAAEAPAAAAAATTEAKAE